jgi:hypothetical protein
MYTQPPLVIYQVLKFLPKPTAVFGIATRSTAHYTRNDAKSEEIHSPRHFELGCYSGRGNPTRKPKLYQIRNSVSLLGVKALSR